MSNYNIVAERVDDFVPIRLATLRVDVLTDFDLYLSLDGGGGVVLYRHKNTEFTEDVRQRLLANRVKRLLISKAERRQYQQYLERHLAAILQDETVPMEERSEHLYESAQGLVQEVLEDPRSGMVLERSKSMVNEMVGFIFREPRSLHHLMRVTSYDYYTYTHSVNVFVYATTLAQRSGCVPQDTKNFGQGALLHDIGKSRVDPSITNCTGKLSDEQWQQMKLHPVHGWEILQEQNTREQVVLEVTRHHHEKLTGKGYPDGLPAKEISPWSRMVAIADIFDALTTRRSYKEAMDSFDALNLMRTVMKEELDQDLFHTFVAMMAK